MRIHSPTQPALARGGHPVLLTLARAFLLDRDLQRATALVAHRAYVPSIS